MNANSEKQERIQGPHWQKILNNRHIKTRSSNSNYLIHLKESNIHVSDYTSLQLHYEQDLYINHIMGNLADVGWE